MDSFSEQEITVYHYMPTYEFKNIFRRGFANSLEPRRSFISPVLRNIPEEAYRRCICALIEPDQWKKNDYTWNRLMYHIYSKADIAENPELNLISLVSFPITKKTDAWVVERNYIEIAIQRAIQSSQDNFQQAHFDYWNSRIPVFEYDRGYFLPEVVIFENIPANCLKEEWSIPAYKMLAYCPKPKKQNYTNWSIKNEAY